MDIDELLNRVYVTDSDIVLVDNDKLKQEIDDIIAQGVDQNPFTNFLEDYLIYDMDENYIYVHSKENEENTKKFPFVSVCTISRKPREIENDDGEKTIAYSLLWSWVNKTTIKNTTPQKMKWMEKIFTILFDEYPNPKWINGGLLFLDAIFDTPKEASIFQAQIITFWLCKKLEGMGCYWTLSFDKLMELVFSKDEPVPPYNFVIVFDEEKFNSI